MIDSPIRGTAADVKPCEIGEIRATRGVVLLATDGSEPAVRATQQAVLLAKLLRARLKVVSVYTGLEELQVPAEPISDEAFAELDLSAQGMIFARRLAAANHVECVLEVLSAAVAGSILQGVVQDGASLIVMGDTGRTGVRRVVLGSVALAVVKASQVPVLVAKAT